MRHKLTDILMVFSGRVVEHRLIMFGKQVKGIFFGKAVQLRESEHFGASLVLGGFVIGASVFKGGRLVMVLTFYECNDVFKENGMFLQLSDQCSQLFFHAE